MSGGKVLMRTSISSIAILAAALAALAPGCTVYDSEAAAEDYDLEVVATDIAFVDGLALHPSGAILATEEYRRGGEESASPTRGMFGVTR